MIGAKPSEPEILYAHVYETPWLRKRVLVLVNGVELKKCVWADVRKGCAQAIATHSDGRPIIGNGECLKHFVYGDVRIERIA